MKKLSLILVGLFLIPSLFLTSCDQYDDTDGEGEILLPEFGLMKTYMVDNNLDFDKIVTNTDNEKFVVGAPDEAGLDAFLAKYHIVDIRSEADYNAGHIKGAINVSYKDILAEGTADKLVLIVCYTGQTACFATALMRLYGFSHTRALKWGMSGWNENTASKWNNAILVEAAADHPSNWNYEGEPSAKVFNDPEISTLSQDGEEILKRRVEAALADGFKTVANTDVMANPTGYFINNYFNTTDYEAYGHIIDAYRILPLTLASDTYLGLNEDPNAKVVTYCYTGQTSALMTAWLRVLGYDAYSLTYGMNGLYNSNDGWGESINKWKPSKSKSLPLE